MHKSIALASLLDKSHTNLHHFPERIPNDAIKKKFLLLKKKLKWLVGAFVNYAVVTKF